MVFVFAKSADDHLASLAKAIDKAVADHADKQLAAVINFTGEATDEYLEKIEEFAEKHGIENTALVVSGDASRFEVSDDVDVTVMHYTRRKVTFNFSAKNDELNDDATTKVIDGLKTMLN